MIDVYKRKIDYIRISVTDRCNLRCIYCMPEKGVKFLQHEEILSYEEIINLCEVFAKIGISKIKITGGEPLVRKNLSDLIKSIKSIDGINNVTLTTNGILLEEQIDDLVKAGLDGVNISIDTLDKKMYKELTRIGSVDDVMRGLKKALTYKNLNVKINCVALKGKNDDIRDIINLAKDNNIAVRFIEMMPIGLGKDIKGYNEDELKEYIENNFGKVTEYNKVLGNGPSHYYELEGYKGKIGFISAVSHKFCESCNRVRLTSTGFLKTCLQFEEGTDLRSLLRNNASKEEIKDVVQKTIYNKPESHRFLEVVKDKKKIEKHVMSQIGG